MDAHRVSFPPWLQHAAEKCVENSGRKSWRQGISALRRNIFRNITALMQLGSPDFHVCFGYELRSWF
jgi:hypothetical protein